MLTEFKLPCLSTSMKDGLILNWLIKEGDRVKPGSMLAEVSVDGTIMPLHAVNDGRIGKILVTPGMEKVLVGAPIALIIEDKGAGLPPGPAQEERPASKQEALAEPHMAIPHKAVKLSSMRKTIARRLTESKQQVPHIYLTVDIQLDPLLELRRRLNTTLEGRGTRFSVNDMLIKALALALMEVPACNVAFAGDRLLRFSRADISVAVSIPNGLITPIIIGADTKPMSVIAAEMKDLAKRAKEGKLKPDEYQGGTASISNMGMYGIKAFGAVINPPQGMIMAVGAGETRTHVVDRAVTVATMMSATGSFDHRAIDGADGAALMRAFKALIENPASLDA